jgi:hypothetical protein
MLALAPLLADRVPDWDSRSAARTNLAASVTQAVRVFLIEHQSGGLFFVIFLEELG